MYNFEARLGPGPKSGFTLCIHASDCSMIPNPSPVARQELHQKKEILLQQAHGTDPRSSPPHTHTPIAASLPPLSNLHLPLTVLERDEGSSCWVPSRPSTESH